jgi:hypothetical protein
LELAFGVGPARGQNVAHGLSLLDGTNEKYDFRVLDQRVGCEVVDPVSVVVCNTGAKTIVRR